MLLYNVPQSTPPGCQSLFIWREPGGEWQCSEGNMGLATLTQILGDYNTATKRLENKCERATTAQAYLRVLKAVGSLSSSAQNLHGALRDAVELIRDPQDTVDLEGPLDTAGSIARANETLETKVMDALRLCIARQRETKTGRWLKPTALCVLFLAIAFIVLGISLHEVVVFVAGILLGAAAAGLLVSIRKDK